jgi:hypothetical protein
MPQRGSISTHQMGFGGGAEKRTASQTRIALEQRLFATAYGSKGQWRAGDVADCFD